MSQSARSAAPTYDYKSLPHPPRGALPPGAGAARPPSRASRSSRYDYIDQTLAAPTPRESRYSQYSLSQARESLATTEPTLQAGNGHPYPLRQQSVSPAPSYGAISRSGTPTQWPNPALDEYMEKRRSVAGTLTDASSSVMMMDKLSYTEEQSHTLLRKEGYRSGAAARQPAKKAGFWTRQKIIVLCLLLLLIAAIAIGLGVWQATKSSTQSKSGASNAQDGAALPGSSSSSPPRPASSSASSSANPLSDVQLWGGAGPVTLLNGTVFTYNNTMGGTWCAVPFNDSARAQSTSPPLSQAWDWSTDLMRGVNLGGWLVLEPFITPSLYAPFANSANPAIDEWTLMQALGANASTVIENHYATFITEVDIAAIASAGLNWVRLPVPYWMIEVYDGEPFLEGVAWRYFQMALAWCRKYGIRVELDLHTAPGSQNGLNHSGRSGSINLLNGVMGIANAQRLLNYIRTLAQFVSQPQYRAVVQGFMVINEPYLTTIGATQMRSFYFQAYNMLRAIGGTGVGNGPMMMIHDGFIGADQWVGFLRGADRVALELHPYLAFSPETFGNPMSQTVIWPCTGLAPSYNQSMGAFGFTVGGEWSLAVNDCGEYVLGVTNPASYGNCAQFLDHRTFSAAFKEQLHDLTQAYQDAMRNFAFWTWKTGISPTTGVAANPLWSYSNGIANGYVPRDARAAVGMCDTLVPKYNGGTAPKLAWTPPLAASATGGAGSNVAIDQQNQYGAWPPRSLTGYANVANFPTYTPTATPITLSASNLFPTSLFVQGVTVGAGNGWMNASDTAPYATPVAGCSYPDPWQGVSAAVPAAPCTGTARAAIVPAVAPTLAATRLRRSPSAPRLTPAPRHRS